MTTLEKLSLWLILVSIGLFLMLGLVLHQLNTCLNSIRRLDGILHGLGNLLVTLAQAAQDDKKYVNERKDLGQVTRENKEDSTQNENTPALTISQEVSKERKGRTMWD